MDIYYACIITCLSDDFECNAVCAREYDENKNLCPCKSGCPNGCPCPDYTCPAQSTTTTTTTTTGMTTTAPGTTPDKPRKSVLILNTWSLSNNVIITDGNGKTEQAGEDFRFIFGEHTEVLYSCSITWHGQFFIFGGSTERRQISKLNGCTLERIGQLLFDQKDGGCAVLNDDIYLCFNTYGDLYDDYRKCRKAREPTGAFDEIRLSSHHHKSTRLGASPGHFLISQLL